MQGFTKHDFGAMLLIDSAVFVLLILGIVTWAVMSGDAYSKAMAWRDLNQGLVVAFASGPFFVLLSRLYEKVEGEAL